MQETILVICNYLRIDFEPKMLDWETSVNQKVPEREAYAHKKLFRKPKESDIFRWKRELSKREILVVESFITDELSKSDYELHFSSGVWKPVFIAAKAYCLTILPSYDFLKRAIRFVWRRIRKIIT